MRTNDLITILATGANAVESNAATRRYAIAMGWGALGSVLLMALILGPRADLAEAILLPMFWVKLAFTGSLAAASLFAAMRLSTPGVRLGRLSVALAAPVLAMWTLAAIVLARSDTELWRDLFFGKTWTSCPFLIAMLSCPVFIAAISAMRDLAPTRLRLAGAAAGLLAGTTGALVYCLHCPELEAPFLGFWYLLGILLPTAAGALLGPRFLRW